MPDVRSTDRLRIDFTESDAANLALLHVFRQDLDGVLHGEVRVLARTLEDIHLLLSIQQMESIVHAASDALFRSIRDELANLEPTFDAENNLVRILRVLGEVLVQEVQGVVFGLAVQLAAVPEVGTQLQRLVQRFKAHLLRGWLGVPSHA